MGKKFTYKLIFANKRYAEYRIGSPKKMEMLGRFYASYLSAFEKSGLSRSLQKNIFTNGHLRKMVMSHRPITDTYARRILKRK